MLTWTKSTRTEEEKRDVDANEALNERTTEDVGINDNTVPSTASISQPSTPTENAKTFQRKNLPTIILPRLTTPMILI
jgi:hypothetical protein